MDKKLVCRGLGSEKWVEADHLNTSDQQFLKNLFNTIIMHSTSLTLMEFTDASGGTFKYRMDYHTDKEREENDLLTHVDDWDE